MANIATTVHGITAAYVAGVWLGGKMIAPLFMLYVLVVMLLVLSVWCICRKSCKLVWVFIVLFFVLGIIRFVHTDTLSPVDISRYAGSNLTIYGTIDDVPQVQTLDEKNKKVRYIITAEKVSIDNTRVLPAAGRVFLHTHVPIDMKVAQYGDDVAASGELLLLHGYNNPGLIDSVAAMKRQGITARMAVSAENIHFETALKNNWRTIIAAWRGIIIENMRKVMPSEDAAVLFGMLFGGYEGIRRDVVAAFSATGLVHILSVSGAHIAMVAGFIQLICGWLRFKPAITALSAAVFVVIYSVFAGFTPPVIRSALMGLVALGAVTFGREKDSKHALVLIALVMVLYQPALIYDISFQLSFGATAGIVYLYSNLASLLSSWPRLLAGPLAVTLAAQLGVLPFLAWYFKTFSLSSFVANLIIVPAVECVVILGLIGVLLSVVWQPGANIIIAFCGLLISVVVTATVWLAALPGGTMYLPPIGIGGGIIYYCILAWIFGYKPQNLIAPSELLRRWPGWSTAFASILLIISIIYYHYPQPVYVHFIDVGQGDAALITTPRGRAVLIDTGGAVQQSTNFDIGERVVVPYLKHYGIREIDYLILTHGHQDHAGGAAAIAESMPVKHLLLAREGYTSAVKALIEQINGHGVIPAYQGQSIMLDGVNISVVYAASSLAIQSRNELSSVIRISYGEHSFLITGDLEAKGEAAVLNGTIPIGSTVLKVGHHGAKTSTTPEFLQAVSPQYGVISVGANNRHGHPHQETLRRLAEQQVKVYRTDQQGAVVFKTDGKILTVATFLY